MVQLEARNAAGFSQTGRRNREDIKIFDIEDVELEESQPREAGCQNYQESKEAKEADFDVRRLNSDPNSFFKVYVREKSPKATPLICFRPLLVLVERIMMLNIATLILVLIFIYTNCIRLYFIITRVKCDERSIVLNLLKKFLHFFLGVLYAVVIKKKLGK